MTIKYMMIILAVCCCSCDRRDLNELYRMAAENELKVRHLEETAFDLNQEITNLRNLTDALMQRLYVSARETADNRLTLTFGDSIQVVINQGVTPLVEIDPASGNWQINGENTGVAAEGKDGWNPKAPGIRINPDTRCWEIAPDGVNWRSTSVKAAGEDGENGKVPVVGINAAGNWTFDGMETFPPVKAVGNDGITPGVPMLGIDKDVDPPVWQISLDGGTTWQPTTIPALAENGSEGEHGEDAPYIESVVVVGDSMIFTFNAVIPGSVPPTRQQKVLIGREKIGISITAGDWKQVGSELWLLFGISDTRTVTYALTGSNIVSVDAVDVPDGFSVRIDQISRKAYITSVPEAAHSMEPYGEITLMATSSDGRTATCSVPVSLVFAMEAVDFSESYVYEITAPSGQQIAHYYLSYGKKIPRGAFRPVKYFYARIFSTDAPPVPNYYHTTLRPCFAEDVDGNRYPLTLFYDGGTPVLWMIENLRTEHYNDGTAIPQLIDPEAWTNDRVGALCYYDNDEGTNKLTMGALYNGHAVASGKLAPLGWNIPTDEIWKECELLAATFYNPIVHDDLNAKGWRMPGVGHRLKANSGWGVLPGGGSAAGSNDYNWFGRPMGFRTSEGLFLEAGEAGYWWSATRGMEGLFYRSLAKQQTAIYRNDDRKMTTGFSVRCFKNLR